MPSLLLVSLLVGAVDEPDLKKEQRLHQIYQQYNLTPTNESTWASVASGKTQTYGIQEGDTLWDLSETLFGDSSFWPKVWSLNADKIENPHEIFPGLSVLFTPGSTGDAPTLDLKATKDLPTEEVPIEDPEKLELLSKATIEPLDIRKAPTPLPPSLPHWTHGRPGGDLKFEVQKINRDFGTPDEALRYYLVSEKPQEAGTLVETEMGTLGASEYQYVSVQFPPGEKAQKVIAVKELGKIEDPFNKTSAYLIEVQGELEVLETVNSEENMYRALVKKAISPVEVGALLIRGDMPTYNAKESALGSASARVIGGQGSVERHLLGTQQLIFLSGQGLNVGETYPIFKNKKMRNEKTKIIENPLQIGRAKVVQVSDGVATALVLQSVEEIQVGDMTNPRALLE